LAELLTQKDIDVLLKAIQTGGVKNEADVSVDESKYKTYDFKRPNKFSKDHMSTLQMIYEEYARVSASYLTGQLRTSVTLIFESIEQRTYEEYLKSLWSPTVLITLNLRSCPGKIFMELNPMFAYQVVDLLCGGMAKISEKNIGLTDIELCVVREVVETLTRTMKTSWDEVVSINPEIEAIDKLPPLEQTIAPNESVAIISIKTLIAGKNGKINLCIPFVSIESVVHKLSVHSWFQHDIIVEDDAHAAQIQSNLQDAHVEVVAELGKARLYIKDFVNLSVGDVVILENRIDEPLSVYVEDRLKFKGYLGLRKQKIAIRISQIRERRLEHE